jgi:hypothetical protein
MQLWEIGDPHVTWANTLYAFLKRNPSFSHEGAGFTRIRSLFTASLYVLNLLQNGDEEGKAPSYVGRLRPGLPGVASEFRVGVARPHSPEELTQRNQEEENRRRDGIAPRKPNNPDAKNLQYVTLSQAAAIAKQSKKTLERWRKEGKLPDPDVLSGKGKANKWLWDALRPALEKEICYRLPVRYPSLTPEI